MMLECAQVRARKLFRVLKVLWIWLYLERRGVEDAIDVLDISTTVNWHGAIPGLRDNN